MTIGLNGQAPLIPKIRYPAPCQIHLFVDCPLSGTDDVIPLKTCSKSAKVLGKCLVLESLCTRLSKLKNTSEGYAQWVGKTSVAYAELCCVLKQYGASDVIGYLEHGCGEGLIEMFPLLEAFTKNKLFPHMLKTPLWDHLHACANYNQIHSLSSVMLDDLLYCGSIKYIAHQFALLYRAMAKPGLIMQPFRIEAEERFPTIKEEVEVYQTLSVDSVEWLISFLTNVKEKAFEAASRDKKMAPFLMAAEI